MAVQPFIDVRRRDGTSVVEWHNARGRANSFVMAAVSSAFVVLLGVLYVLVFIKDVRSFDLVGKAVVALLGLAAVACGLSIVSRWSSERVVIQGDSLRHSFGLIPLLGRRVHLRRVTEIFLGRLDGQRAIVLQLQLDGRPIQLGGVLHGSALQQIAEALVPVLLEARPRLEVNGTPAADWLAGREA